jgi:hypothetical protein
LMNTKQYISKLPEKWYSCESLAVVTAVAIDVLAV